ncbi:MAG: rod shape-determining protein RodA [Bacteroidetes bacterium]|nr:MAG: rod shape-determining protein RodA [Bacteroidota bacterium]RLD86261.1 MAG: rod shape-determining protein RodA [Bacteroidota bacterium]
MKSRESIIGNVDWVIVLLYFLLVFFGWLSIYASSGGDTAGSVFDLSTRYGKQLLWIGLAVVMIVAVLLIDAKFFSSFAFVFYGAMILVLIGVLLFGKTVAGSRSWFQIGSFAIQPSEFTKFATALAVAKYLSMTHVDMKNLKTPVIAMSLAGFPALLILLQNDTGSALVYASFALVLFREGFSGSVIFFGFVLAVLFILTLLFGEIYMISTIALLLILLLVFFRKTRKNYKSIIALFLLSSAFVFSVNYAFQNVLEPHQKKRINVLLGIEEDLRGAGYNVNQSKIAIGSGGFTGKGFRQGMLTRYNFVPEQSTDFIFCTVGEEWGFMGTSVVILLFLGLLVRIVVLAERQRSRFSRIYGYGVVSILFFHFAVNIGMTIGLAPVVGIPLPFFSYGGSSLWGFTLLLFLFVKQDADRLKVL